MSLTEKQKREFRQRGHALKPVVTIGSAGLSQGVLRELGLSLEHHELMKIRLSGADREGRRQLIEEICHACHAEPVQAIGAIALIYRKRQE